MLYRAMLYDAYCIIYDSTVYIMLCCYMTLCPKMYDVILSPIILCYTILYYMLNLYVLSCIILCDIPF